MAVSACADDDTAGVVSRRDDGVFVHSFDIGADAYGGEGTISRVGECLVWTLTDTGEMVNLVFHESVELELDGVSLSDGPEGFFPFEQEYLLAGAPVRQSNLAAPDVSNSECEPDGFFSVTAFNPVRTEG